MRQLRKQMRSVDRRHPLKRDKEVPFEGEEVYEDFYMDSERPNPLGYSPTTTALRSPQDIQGAKEPLLLR